MTGELRAAVWPRPGSVEPPADRAEPWHTLSRLLAAAALVLLGARINLPLGLTAGTVVAVALLPLWLGALRRYAGATGFLLLGVVTVLAGAVLTQFSAVDHATSTSRMVENSMQFAGMLLGAAVVLWARTMLPDGAVAAWFGVGLLVGVSPGSPLFASNPWKFGFSVGATIVVLGLAQLLRRRAVELVAVLVLAGISAVTDARSSFAILLLTALLVAWQMRPAAPTRRGSATRALLAVGALGVIVYSVGQALILEGYLGEETQRRSEAQLEASGSLLLGGRPELAATAALFRYHPWGFGSGTQPSLEDVLVAKTGMWSLNYDPNNGYVEGYMFGDGYELHSMAGDFWANYGVLGLVFTGALVVVTLRGVGARLGGALASGVLLYLAIRTLWNLAFSPFYSSIPMTILLLGLVFLPRTSTADPATVHRAEDREDQADDRPDRQDAHSPPAG